MRKSTCGAALQGCRICLCLAAILVCSAPAEAQRAWGVRGYADASYQAFTASDTFDAIFGETDGPFVGGGGQFRWHNLLVEVSASRFKKTGERVFVNGSQVFRLGIPATVTVTPIELTAAWRFDRIPWLWRLQPYAGGGIGTHRFKETSRFADSGENVRESHRSYHVAGGAEVPVWRWISAAAEARYRHAPGLIGKGGVSKQYNEDDLGGTSVRVKILVGL